ncbi:MAG: four helix bundle protein [Planctomycetota bacterium]|jgi:four helix bundle protein
MDKDQLKRRTKEFAHRCVSMALPKSCLGNHIKSQLIRCSTSVASNYRAACIAQSKASFISKLAVVIEEGKELTAIFVSSRKTARKIVNIQ